MKKTAESIGTIISGGIAIVILATGIYGLYWIGKTVSYGFFYEDMVEKTIEAKVKPSCLK